MNLYAVFIAYAYKRRPGRPALSSGLSPCNSTWLDSRVTSVSLGGGLQSGIAQSLIEEFPFVKQIHIVNNTKDL
jgi:hypothetical protein